MKSSVRTATIRGYGIKYWTYGTASKPTIILVHGFTGSHEGFQYVLPHLSDYHVVVPDLPGFGESELGSDNWGIDDIATRVNEFVVSLGLKKPPYLVSHSMGGLIAAAMLARAPKLYHKKTVFISPATERIPWFDFRNIGAWASSAQYFVGKNLPVLGPKLVKSKLLSRIGSALIMTTPSRTLRKEIYQHHFKNLDYISSIAFYYQLHREIIRTGTLDYADKLKPFEVLLISGAKDIVTPLAGQRRFQQAVDGQIRVIPGVGHLLQYETPIAIAEAMREFLHS